MNNSSDLSASPENILGARAVGSLGYAIGLSLGIMVLFVIVTYFSYLFTRMRRGAARRNHRSSTRRRPTDDDSTTDEESVVASPKGLDEATISSYPQLLYSQVKPYKCDSTSSACSICLADYKDADLLKLLPECGHVFHLNCIQPWLMLHPTCPICRKSP